MRGLMSVQTPRRARSFWRGLTQAPYEGSGLGDADQERGNRLRLSLERKLEVLSAGTGIDCRTVCGCAQHDLAAFRFRLKTSSGVGHVAERGEVLEAAATDVADVLLAGTDADTDIEPVALWRSVTHCV